MIQKLLKKQSNSILAIATAVLLAVVTLVVTVLGDADLSGTIAVSGLTANSSGAKDWTASAGGAVWEGTTTSSGGCSPTYTATNGTLVFTNNSGSTQVLSFSYTLSLNGGSFTIDGASKDANGSFSATLANGATVTLVAKSSSSAANTTKVTLSNIKLEVQSVNITFAPSTNGSYTFNGTAVTASTTVTNPSTTTYKLVATPAENYYFAGWYLGDTKVYDTATVNAASFATSGTVTAKFSPDPLYNQATTPDGSTKTKEELVSINSFYSHDTTNKLVADGTFPANNSAYSKTATSKIKDKIDVQYIPSQVWNSSMSIASSGTAMGDYVDGGAQESYAYARVLSDIIRIKIKENCNISFSYEGSFTTGGSTATEKNANAYFYVYTSTSASATVAQVKGGSCYSGNGTTPTIALSEGSYLYILAEGYAKNRYLNVFGSSQFSMSFEYSASITNFKVEYNEIKHTMTAGFQDNTGKTLGSGQITVNGTNQAIGTNGYMADMALADQASAALSIGSVPANYVHIGWAITPKDGSTTYQYTATYTRTLTEDVTIIALFVPKMTITMGENGYTDATYKLPDGTAASGQYVARNAGRTEYYTSLKDAFDKTNVVVLLAGATINGDWEIPSGKTFVIPYGINDAGSITPVMGGGMGADYCLVAFNGNLTVNGTLIVSAQQNQTTGATGGNPGHLNLASNAHITVNGSLYSYGPVTGAGSITAGSQAVIHEFVEISDNRPVMYVYNIYDERSSKKVFPFNAFFFKNIEVPVTYQRGAALKGHAAVRYDTVSTAEISLIGSSGALLNCTSGSITKYYDHSAGQFVIRVDENSVAETGSFSITMTITVAGRTMDITMDSADYYVPFAAPFRLEVAGNLTFSNNDYKFLPGAALDVKPSGKLTIASKCNLVFYRLNDYDYRGKHANSTEQWGYGERAYPLNPTRFNGVTYPFTFTADNVGSAKLNVDGKLIVNGGLYVTNSLQTAGNGIVLRANGYNVLTGYGTIDMTNAKNDLDSINEAMTAQGTNDLAWDTVAVVHMMGLKPDATADEASQYVSLTGKSGGVTNGNGLNVWLTGAPELNVAYRLNDYLWFNGYFTEDYIVNPTTSIGLSGNSLQTAVSSGKRYVVKSIPADEIPNDLTFTLTFTAPDGATYSRNFTVNLATYSAGDDEELKQALLAYGNAAKDYADSNTTLENGHTVSGNPVEESQKLSSIFKPQVWNGISVETTGANIYFDEALRLGISYQLSGIPEGYTIKQIGLLVGDISNTNLTLENRNMAYLLFNAIPNDTVVDGDTITNAEIGKYPDNGPWNTDDKIIVMPDGTFTVPTISGNGTSGTIVFDLKAQEYKTMFSLRPAIVFEKDGEYVCVYGRQIGYGLGAYINGVYDKDSEGNATTDEFKYLLEQLWALAGVTSPATGG